MLKKLKKIVIFVALIVMMLSLNNGCVKAEELNDNSNSNDVVQEYANYTQLDLYISYANNILNGDTSVYVVDSISSLTSVLNNALDYKNANPQPSVTKQDEIDALSLGLSNCLYGLKVNDSMLNQIKVKIDEANQIINSGNEYDEDDFVLLQNVTSEAETFMNDYEANGIVVFLPNNKTIGQVTEEVYGEVYRLSNKIANAIERINLLPVTLPDLSNYKGESIVGGLEQVGEDGSYSSRDLLYAKAGFSDTYYGSYKQNVTMLSYFKGNGANILDLELSIASAQTVLENSDKYEDTKDLEKLLKEAVKFLDKYNKLGVKVLPTKQDKVDLLKANLISALKELILIQIDNTKSNDIKAEISNTISEINSYISLSDSEIIDAIRNQKDLYVFVEVTDYKDRISDSDKLIIQSVLESDEKLGTYLDINLFKKIGNSKVQVNATDGNIKISLTLPDELINKDENKTRTYYIIRLHDGEVTRIPVTLENGVIAFESDQFSVYAISYVDKSIDSVSTKSSNNNLVKNPKTGDNIVFYIILLSISFISLVSLRKVSKYFN